MENPKATIVILNWNTALDTIECLESLKKQTEKDFEVIVVDNASVPEDVIKLKEYCKNESPLEIQLVLNKENLGFAGGNNAGLKYAKGEVVVSLNNDAVATENWLERLLEPFSDPQVGGAGSKIIYYHERDKKILQFAGGRLAFYGAPISDMQGKPDTATETKPQETGWVMGAAFAVRKNILKDIGEWLCNYYFAYYEEVDFSWRVRSAGYKLVYCPASVAYHKGSVSVKKNASSLFQWKLSLRNKYLTFWRNLPAHKFLLVFPFLLGYDLLRCAKYSALAQFYFPRAFFTALKEFLFSLNKVDRPRRGRLSDLSF